MKMIIGFIFGIFVASALAQMPALPAQGILGSGKIFNGTSTIRDSLPIKPNYIMAIAAQTFDGNTSIIQTDERGYVICSDYRSPSK